MIEALVNLCLPKSIGQNGMIHYVPEKCEIFTCASKSARSIGQKGMIHLVSAKCEQIT